MTSMLDARGIGLPGRLSPVDVTARGGEMIALVGPNGGGKTSLLRALARIEGATGAVLIDGEDLEAAGEARRRRLLSFLPASREIAWPIAVRDVIALSGAGPAQVDAMISAFGLETLAGRSIGALSTGERARALLARALASQPRLLLLDEPLSNLDPFWVLRTLDLLRAEADRGATLLVALHDLALIERFDRLLLLDGGKLVADGTPGEVSGRVGALFGVEATAGGSWRISPRAGPQSSR